MMTFPTEWKNESHVPSHYCMDTTIVVRGPFPHLAMIPTPRILASAKWPGTGSAGEFREGI